MEKYALLIGGILFIGEGGLKFFHFELPGMDMPCGASLIIVGVGLGLHAVRQLSMNRMSGD